MVILLLQLLQLLLLLWVLCRERLLSSLSCFPCSSRCCCCWLTCCCCLCCRCGLFNLYPSSFPCCSHCCCCCCTFPFLPSADTEILPPAYQCQSVKDIRCSNATFTSISTGADIFEAFLARAAAPSVPSSSSCLALLLLIMLVLLLWFIVPAGAPL